ncbi:MAG: hypothetical protein JXB45_12645, partial [Candidatus Krumholzibacteriota bacterium]|nr:hypothetical protein [Candidatus Krumholzibacteriota bacterium]
AGDPSGGECSDRSRNAGGNGRPGYRFPGARGGVAALILVLLICLTLAGGIVSSSRAGDLSDREIADHLSQAEAFFREALQRDSSDPEAARDLYQKALLHFERIVNQGGIRNGKLYYNIGNVYFRLGDPGRAILNYRRASLYIPNDSNLRQNLSFARDRRENRIEKKEREKVFKTLFFLHYDIPLRIRFLILLVTFALIWICAALRLLFRGAWPRVTLVVFSVLTVIFLASVVVERIGNSRRPAGVVVADSITARKGDAETFQPSFTEPLNSGVEFNVLEKRSDWWYIELEDGSRCWIPSHSGELVIE